MKSSVDEAAPREWTIGELAAHFGLATHVLRHWEAAGLLQPARRTNGRRRYTEADRVRIAIIAHGRRTGFGLTELRTVLTAADGAARREVLHRRRAELDEVIARATASRALVDHALACESADFLRCQNFQDLVHALDPPACATDSQPDR
jgi:MerR family copper efflux transcriptional regulator